MGKVTVEEALVRKALYALFATDTEEGTEAYELELEVIAGLKAALRQDECSRVHPPEN